VSLLQFIRVKTCEVLIDNKLENMPGLKELEFPFTNQTYTTLKTLDFNENCSQDLKANYSLLLKAYHLFFVVISFLCSFVIWKSSFENNGRRAGPSSCGA